jgi:quercetin dioxygenase-like cupin family protein
MRFPQFLAVVLTGVVVSGSARAAHAQEPAPPIQDPGPEQHIIYRAADVEWQDGPASFQPGAQFAVLEGDPSRPGVFTMRIRMPDGFVIAPHWHPNVERVTVVSGTFRVGHGDVFDSAATQPLDAGSYFSFPPEMRHFAVAEGETIVQLTSVGPWQIRYVDPRDDPRADRR